MPRSRVVILRPSIDRVSWCGMLKVNLRPKSRTRNDVRVMLDTGTTLAHTGISGPAPFVAMALFFLGIGAALGAYRLAGAGMGSGARRAAGIGLGVLALGCFGLATALPVILRATPTVTRPTTSAHLRVLSPLPGAVIRGDPASVAVRLGLTGGRIVPVTSLHLIENAGHIHLYLDGTLVSMTGLEGVVTVPPGLHRLRAEFVAVDHGPFHPRIIAAVTFRVLG
jgi:hypothetical protein